MKMGTLVTYHHPNGYDVPAILCEAASTHIEEDEDGNEIKTTTAPLFILASSTMVNEGNGPGQFSAFIDDDKPQYRSKMNAQLRDEIRARGLSVPAGANKEELAGILEEDDAKQTTE